MLKMNVGSVKTKDYENKRLCGLRENKPKTNPIKPNFKGKKAHYVEVFELCDTAVSTRRRVAEVVSMLQKNRQSRLNLRGRQESVCGFWHRMRSASM